MRLPIFAALVATLALVTPAFAAGRFFAPAQESASAGIAADASGDLHATHTGYDGDTGDTLYYSSCAAACETAGNWRTVSFPFTDPQIVQIAVTADGRPRL